MPKSSSIWRKAIGIGIWVGLLLGLISSALAQGPTRICFQTGTNVNQCQNVDASNPFPSFQFARVVAACGTLPVPFTATGLGTTTVDVNGVQCVSATITPSGTQNVNLTQILGAAPSATNPIWVSPATASTPWVVSIADGANVVEGTTADAASTQGGTGTLSAKLRLLTTQFNTLNTTVATAANQTTMATNQTAVQGPVPAGAATATKFNLGGGESLTTAPTLTNGQQSPFQLETRGALKSSPYSGATAIADATGGAWAQGAIASGATDSGNPVKVGARYNSTKPTLTDGQRGDMQLGTRGMLGVTLYPENGASPFLPLSATANVTGTGNLAVGLIAQLDDTSPTTITENQFGNLRLSGERALYVAPLPSATAASGITPVVSTSAESGHVLKASAGNLYSLTTTTAGTAGYVMVFNAISAPGDGAVTPIECVVVAANSTVSINYNPGPPSVYGTGITAVFSSTGCFTKTASATAFFSGKVQ